MITIMNIERRLHPQNLLSQQTEGICKVSPDSRKPINHCFIYEKNFFP